MEDDDDLYDNEDTVDSREEGLTQPNAVKEEAMEDELESGEEEESSDSDVEFVLDKPEREQQSTAQSNRYAAVKTEQGRETPVTQSKTQTRQAVKTESAPAAQKLADGSTYPEQRTSTVDVNADPIYEEVGKPITQVDIDADLAEHTKPWRLPGSDPSDYFNYGFDEFTWAQYLIRQQTMASTLEGQKAETQQFQMMFGGGGGMPGMPPTPAGPVAGQQGGGSMPGMPNEQEMMQMMQMMAAQGQDPSQMDFNTFMQQAGANGGGGGFVAQGQGQGQGQNQGSYNNYGGQNQGHGAGTGGGGRGRRGGRW